MFRHMKASDLNTVVGKVISVGKNAVKEEKLINKITKNTSCGMIPLTSTLYYETLVHCCFLVNFK